MKDDFYNWNVGFVAVLLVSIIIYFISNAFFSHQLSFLESWGITMIGITLFSGVQSYNTSKNANVSE